MSAARDLLVIDDEPVVLAGVSRIGESEGWSVDTAESGRDGLRMLEAGPYRLILCDIMMEGCDGFQFLAEAARRQLATPVIMTTGYSTVEHAVRSLRNGALDFLAKPFTMDELLAVVHRGFAIDRLGADGRPGATGGCPPAYHRLGRVSWAAPEPEGTVRVGVSDLFLRALGGLQRLTLYPVGSELIQGLTCAEADAPDGLSHHVMGPISGRVLEANPRLLTAPDLLLRDPYGEGWLYRLVPADLAYNLRFLECAAPAPSGPAVNKET